MKSDLKKIAFIAGVSLAAVAVASRVDMTRSLVLNA